MKEEEPNTTSQLDVLSDVLPTVIAAFRRLDDTGREKLLRTVATIFGISAETTAPTRNIPQSIQMAKPSSGERFSADRPVSPKEFLLKKQPQTDVERVACLAYYLTNYRDQQYFKTLDISKLNTEAAQIKFSNPAKAVNNATTYGYLASASKGNKQLSAPGEQFVDALPDRDAARAAMASARTRRKSKRNNRKIH